MSITIIRLNDLIQTVIGKGPHRVMISADEAVPVMSPRAKSVDVVFIRNDGWTLGAPYALEADARKQWDGDWIARVDVRTKAIERFGEFATAQQPAAG